MVNCLSPSCSLILGSGGTQSFGMLHPVKRPWVLHTNLGMLGVNRCAVPPSVYDSQFHTCTSVLVLVLSFLSSPRPLLPDSLRDAGHSLCTKLNSFSLNPCGSRSSQVSVFL